MTEQAKNDGIPALTAQRAIAEILQESNFTPLRALEAVRQRVAFVAQGERFDSSQYYELQHPNQQRYTVTLEILVDSFGLAGKLSRIDERGDRIVTVKPEVKVNWGGYGAVSIADARSMAEVITAAITIAMKLNAILRDGVTYVSQTAAEIAEESSRREEQELQRAIINAWAGDEGLRHALYDTRKGVTKHAALPTLLRSQAERCQSASQHVTYNLMIPGKKTKVYKLGISGNNTYATRIG